MRDPVGGKCARRHPAVTQFKKLALGRACNCKEVFGEAFSKSFEERRLFGKRRHPKILYFLSKGYFQAT
ncbi:hypothetical protein C3920_09690 [Novacetimonas pomaceti]|uniref:Uncharacterized protein n=1 Tax=Novacetimonas pomaceti TaxID=2021998 RepID=A0ABX5P141_9PROT|nr:hypothetical protein C3920_09690 [Novacetimonas pomaceti]